MAGVSRVSPVSCIRFTSKQEDVTVKVSLTRNLPAAEAQQAWQNDMLIFVYEAARMMACYSSVMLVGADRWCRIGCKFKGQAGIDLEHRIGIPLKAKPSTARTLPEIVLNMASMTRSTKRCF